MIYPDFKTVLESSADNYFTPIVLETHADTETPISVFKRFKDTSQYCFLLDSVEGGEKWARYSFIGRNPLMIFQVDGKTVTMTHRDQTSETFEGNPFDILRDQMKMFKTAKIQGVPRLSGGAVGFFGYDMVRSIEDLPNAPEDRLHLPDGHFMVVDEMIVFDHLRQKLQIIVNMKNSEDMAENYKRTIERLHEIEESLHDDELRTVGNKKLRKNFFVGREISSMTKEQYMQSVEKAKEYILNGDIFQVVLSRRTEIETDADPLEVYRVLRVSNPSPYMYFLKFDQYSLVGASPEMLVRYEDGFLETCPIAGTRPRGMTKEEDDLLEKDLMSDEKELAEHRMLIDLGRNDIGKIAKFGSVQLQDMMKVAKYSHVMHITTLVQGQARENINAFDALRAVLPAGTLSGAPKIRAMEIIDELEPCKRGPYGGAIGYISFDGNLDSCITIRTILFKDGKAYMQAGAGIVADSVPETEFQETVNKAGALIKALREVGGKNDSYHR
jgi:anthranilate synthase component 1